MSLVLEGHCNQFLCEAGWLASMSPVDALLKVANKMTSKYQLIGQCGPEVQGANEHVFVLSP